MGNQTPAAVGIYSTDRVDSIQWLQPVPTAIPVTAVATDSATDPAATPAEFYQQMFHLWEFRAFCSTLSQKLVADPRAECNIPV